MTLAIEFEYQRPTPTHCDAVVHVNGSRAGTLHLRQDELALFEAVLAKGLHRNDTFRSRGNPNPQGWA